MNLFYINVLIKMKKSANFINKYNFRPCVANLCDKRKFVFKRQKKGEGKVKGRLILFSKNRSSNKYKTQTTTWPKWWGTICFAC